MATIFPLKHKWNEVGKKKECYCSVKALYLHCNCIEFVGQKHCFLLTTAICLKVLMLQLVFNLFSTTSKQGAPFLFAPLLFSSQRKENTFHLLYNTFHLLYIWEKEGSLLKENMQGVAWEGHCLLGFYIMHKVEIEGVFLVFFVMFSALFFPLLIIRKEGIGMLGHIIYLGKY